MMELKTRKDLHLSRKAFHFLCVSFIFSCTLFLKPTQYWSFFLFVGITIVAIDLLRQKNQKINHAILQVLNPLMRTYERDHLFGASYGVIGLGTTLTVFPFRAAQLAFLFLAIADPVASFFGTLYGRPVLKDKSAAGFLAAFVSCFLASFVYFHWILELRDQLVVLSGLSGLIGALSELITLGNLDDNLTQPLISGLLLTLLFYIWGL